MSNASASKTPHHFKIVNSDQNSDNTCAFFSIGAMKLLSLEEGDFVQVFTFRSRKNTLLAAYSKSDIISSETIEVSHIIRKNLGAEVGDSIRVKHLKHTLELQKIIVKKIGGFAPCATSEKHEQKFLTEYFGQYYRPVCLDNIFQLKTKLGNMEFIITHAEPFIHGYVTENTMIAIDWNQ